MRDGKQRGQASADEIDPGGFERFFASSKGVVFAACLTMVGDEREYAADLTQEAFARALENWPIVSAHANPQAWVLRVARNLSTSHWRRAMRAVHMGSPRPVPPVATEEQVVSDGTVVEIMLTLPRAQRVSTYLVIVAGYSIEEAARVIGCSASTVRTHLQRAREALQRQSGLTARDEW